MGEGVPSLGTTPPASLRRPTHLHGRRGLRPAARAHPATSPPPAPARQVSRPEADPATGARPLRQRVRPLAPPVPGPRSREVRPEEAAAQLRPGRSLLRSVGSLGRLPVPTHDSRWYTVLLAAWPAVQNATMSASVSSSGSRVPACRKSRCTVRAALFALGGLAYRDENSSMRASNSGAIAPTCGYGSTFLGGGNA